MNIRKMEEKDHDFILGLSSRFNEFEFMSWRDPEKMDEAQIMMAKEAIQNPNSIIFVAEDEFNQLLGYLHVTTMSDYFTGVEQGYVSSIAVAKEGEGKGVGRKLMEKAEEWAKSKGYQQLVLNVFDKNERALKMYQQLGFEKEIIKMVKEI
ncbi:GNAT family N-acetyltransferase [Bacillus sp. 31A1R]|uniref:GNAT family N-acetyltransferase n=1 Tax=Robertmurraya mangrovi TaxID=3098077 RepID=A0ABU5IWF7_9BACI|nr:GNAT family N-acetyltransferase [Bacillus sp. 31A1R]MDZ5471477.1 GNAT family N-acetyltransferase [Bacillus sp. 31A1R]